MKCRFCGAPITDFGFLPSSTLLVCKDCATKHDKQEQEEFEATREEEWK